MSTIRRLATEIEHPEPWIIAMNDPPNRATVRDYACRWGIEIYQPYNLRKTQVIMIQWWQAIARCGRRLALPVIVPT